MVVSVLGAEPLQEAGPAQGDAETREHRAGSTLGWAELGGRPARASVACPWDMCEDSEEEGTQAGWGHP